jgi:hypothetical protein
MLEWCSRLCAWYSFSSQIRRDKDEAKGKASKRSKDKDGEGHKQKGQQNPYLPASLTRD